MWIIKYNKKIVILLIFTLVFASSVVLYKVFQKFIADAAWEVANDLCRGIDSIVPKLLIQRKFQGEVEKVFGKSDYTQSELVKNKKPNDVVIHLRDLAGLRSGDLIRNEGIQVGKIEIVDLDYSRDDPHGILLIFNDKNFKLTDHSRILVQTLGLKNEKYLEIIEENLN